MANQKLLLVEDDLTLGELLLSVFDKTGHSVTWFVRARLQDGALTFMDADGVESVLPADGYALALVDFRLKGSALDGPDVTTQLVKAGIPVVGISGLRQLNELMVQAGARGGISKDELFSRVLRHELVVDHNFCGVK